MKNRLANADIVSLFVKPGKYRDFAAPVKLYEYLGYRKPIIASEGTLAGDFVTENGIGWSIPYSEDVLSELISRLKFQPKELKAIRDRLEITAPLHTWKARALKVIEDLAK